MNQIKWSVTWEGRTFFPLLYLIPTLSKVALCVRGQALPLSCHYKPRKYTVIIIS